MTESSSSEGRLRIPIFRQDSARPQHNFKLIASDPSQLLSSSKLQLGLSRTKQMRLLRNSDQCRCDVRS